MRALFALVLLCGCPADSGDLVDLLRADHAEPDPAGCTLVGEEDRDSNGFFDFARTFEHDTIGQPFLVRETETDNGGEPPIDPVTYRVDTEFDQRSNPEFVREGPDDDSPRTLTGYRWDYAGSGLQERAEIDRRNNGQDIVHWTFVYGSSGRLETWEVDERDVGGELWLFTYRWDGLEVRSVDRSVGEEPQERGGWRWEHDSFGRVVRQVEIDEDGAEGREALFERDAEGWILEQNGVISERGDWAPTQISWSRDCG